MLKQKQRLSWIELVADNYLACSNEIGISIQKLSEMYPTVFHTLGLSVASSDPLDMEYLEKIKKLKSFIKPVWISDHLCWASKNGNYFFDLLPFPMTEEVALHVAKKISLVQDFFQEPLLLENISQYVFFNESNMNEIEFFNFLFKETGCLMLLDINNLYVNSKNNSTSPEEFLKKIPKERVKQIHLAGFTDQGDYLIDTHSSNISNDVWRLYKKAIKMFGKVPTCLEWDEKIPNFSEIINEIKKIEINT